MVVTDDVEGGRIATGHLLALGHERIAFIGDDPDNPFGFTASPARERGLPRDARARPAFPTRSRARALRAARPHRRAAADRTAVGPTRRDRRRCSRPRTCRRPACSPRRRWPGLRVPEDLSVVGFDDIEISAYAGLTTVRQPLFESGRIGAELLLAALDRGRRNGDERHATDRAGAAARARRAIDDRPATGRRD